MEDEKIKLKSIPVYLPTEKHNAVKQISAKKRVPITRLIEAEVDNMLKREGYDL